jgi:hypothetical protein
LSPEACSIFCSIFGSSYPAHSLSFTGTKILFAQQGFK